MRSMFLNLAAIGLLALVCTGCQTADAHDEDSCNCAIECAVLGNGPITHAECQAAGWETCASATLIARVDYGSSSSLVTLPLDCETPYEEGSFINMVEQNLIIPGGSIHPDLDTSGTCCRLN